MLRAIESPGAGGLKRAVRLCCVALSMLVLASLPVRASEAEVVQDDQSKSALKVLFIGNSYVFVNDLPRLFASLVRSGSPRPLKIYSTSFPSYTLKEHLADSRTMNALEREGPWDYVVLQERSYYPMAAPDEMQQSCIDLDQKIKAAGARTILLETWADEATPNTQETINSVYRAIGKRIGSTVCGAGEVWSGATKSQKLYGEDGHHPSLAGSYLVACCLYKTIVGKDPQAIPEQSVALPSSVSRQIKSLVGASQTSISPGSAAVRTVSSTRSGATRSTGTSNGAANNARGVNTYHW
jgi:hypothetical protein